MMLIFLDEEYRQCRIRDQWNNAEQIKRNDVAFKREALAKQGKRARRYAKKGGCDGVREDH